MFDLDKYALEYATCMHEAQYRYDGNKYIVHPINVASYVKAYGFNSTDIICASYLHDVLEDTDASFYDLVNIFGLKISSLVLELTNSLDIIKLFGKTEYLKLKMKYMSETALVIKLCDRLDNVSSLECCDLLFIKKYLVETKEIITYLINNRFLDITEKRISFEILRRVNKISDSLY